VNAGDIEPGTEIIVPSGADFGRKLPYRLQVRNVNVSRATGAVTVTGRLQRMDGGPTAKRGTAAHRTVTFSLVALAKIQLAPEKGNPGA
jgi:hypothetical protein